MTTQYSNTLVAYAEDIKSRTFMDWLRAHTSFMKPLYRYQGMLTLDTDMLIFHGKERNSDNPYRIEIPLQQVQDVHFGFDNVYRRREDRQLGMFNFKPLRITFKIDGGERRLYLFAHFRNSIVGRLADNEEIYRKLKDAGF